MKFKSVFQQGNWIKNEDFRFVKGSERASAPVQVN